MEISLSRRWNISPKSEIALKTEIVPQMLFAFFEIDTYIYWSYTAGLLPQTSKCILCERAAALTVRIWIIQEIFKLLDYTMYTFCGAMSMAFLNE